MTRTINQIRGNGMNKAKPAAGHATYKLADGTRVPGVTTILGVLNKPALIPWANKMGLQGIDTSKYVDKLAAIGTLAHYLIQCHLQEETPHLAAWSTEQVGLAENALLSFFEWERGHLLEQVICEQQLVSEAFRYGGTIDCCAILDGIPTIVDFKTGKAIYAEHLYQVAAYRNLLEEQGQTVEAVRILQVGRDETEGFSERIVTDTSKHFQLFEHCLSIYRLKRELEK